MKKIALSNEKGGVAKTTIATHLAAGLAIQGYRVVLVDTDPQGHATVAMGHKKEPGFYNLTVYPDSYSFQNTLRPVNPDLYVPPRTKSEGQLWVLPTDASARNVAGMTNNIYVIQDVFSALDEVVDYVIFDTSPTPSMLHGSIYMAMDYILYPTECAPFSFDGLAASIGRRGQINQQRQGLGLDDLKIAGIIPTMVRPNTLAHEQSLEMLRKQFGDAVWAPTTLATVWEQAQHKRKMLYAFAPDSTAAKQAWSIVERTEAIAV